MHTDQNTVSSDCEIKTADPIGDKADPKGSVREFSLAENVQNIKDNLLKEDRSKKMWLREAKRYQRNGNYKQALEIYQKFNLIDEYKKCEVEIQGINKMIEKLRVTDKNPPAESTEKNARQQSDIDDYLAIRGLSDEDKLDYFVKKSFLYYGEHKFYEALQAIKQALAIRAEPLLFGQCGMLLLFNHEYDQAIQYFNLAQDKQTMDPGMYVMRAEAYSALGQNSLALRDCDKAEIEGCSEAYLFQVKAQVLYAMQQFEKAIPYFQKAAKKLSDDIFLRGKLINCCVYTGSFDLALKEAEKLERHDPNHYFVVGLLILVLLKTKKNDFARIKCQHYIRVRGLPKTVDDTLKEFVGKAKEWDVEHHGQDWVTFEENRTT